MYDVRYSGSSSCYDSDSKEQQEKVQSVSLLQLSLHLSVVLQSHSSSDSCSLHRYLRCIRITLWYLYSITVLLDSEQDSVSQLELTDLVFSASLPAAEDMADHSAWYCSILVFYVVFRFAIVKFDLKTPGREDDDDNEAEKSAVLSNDDFTEVAKIILEGVGGKENVKSIDNCITRLRLEINDYTKVDEKKIKSAGVAGVIRPSKTAVQVIVGMKSTVRS